MVPLSVRNEIVLFNTAQLTTQLILALQHKKNLFGSGELNPVLLSSRKGGQKRLWEAVRHAPYPSGITQRALDYPTTLDYLPPR
jgi:hypothetical protein